MTEHPTARIAFIDVGQGDTIVVTIPETQEAVVVDCVDADAVLTYLEREAIEHIRGILITHLHQDHFSGVVQLLENAEHEVGLACERVLCQIPRMSRQLQTQLLEDADGHSSASAGIYSSRSRENSLRGLLRWIENHPSQCSDLTRQSGLTLPLAGSLELIHPWLAHVPHLTAVNPNNASAVIKVHGPGSNALLTGDLEPYGWASVERTNLKSDVLKFPHHGAWRDGDPDELLDAVEPSLIVVSVGTDGARYNHPNNHVFEAIARHPDIVLLCTQATNRCGDVINHRLQIVDLLQERHDRHGDIFFEQNGCPCAGTIIIELGETVSVLQPDLHFHRQTIIRPHYRSHQCNW